MFFVALFVATQASAQLPVIRGSVAQNAGSSQNSNQLVSDTFSYPFGYGGCTEFRLLDYRVTSDMLDPKYLDSNDIPIHTGEDWNRRVEAGGGGDNDLGDPVCSIGDGVVTSTGSYPTWSNVIVIRHDMPDGSTRWSQYAHLSEVSVSEGPIRRGQMIGRIGKQFPEIACNTTTGEYCAHLHFEIRQKNVDPWNWPRDSLIIQRQYLDPTDVDRDVRPETGFVEGNQISIPEAVQRPLVFGSLISYGGETRFEPVATVIRDNQFASIDSWPEGRESFLRMALPRGLFLRILSNGREAGTATVIEAIDALPDPEGGCTVDVPHARVLVTSGASLDSEFFGWAYASTAPLGITGRPASPRDRRAFLEAARRVRPYAELASHWDVLVAESDGKKYVAGAIYRSSQGSFTETLLFENLDSEATLLLWLNAGPAADPMADHANFAPNELIDLTHDGIPEVIVDVDTDEAGTIEIYGLTSDGWKLVASRGWIGC